MNTLLSIYLIIGIMRVVYGLIRSRKEIGPIILDQSNSLREFTNMSHKTCLTISTIALIIASIILMFIWPTTIKIEIEL